MVFAAVRVLRRGTAHGHDHAMECHNNQARVHGGIIVVPRRVSSQSVKITRHGFGACPA